MKTTCQRALFLLDKPVFLICFLCLYSLSHLLQQLLVLEVNKVTQKIVIKIFLKFSYQGLEAKQMFSGITSGNLLNLFRRMRYIWPGKSEMRESVALLKHVSQMSKYSRECFLFLVMYGVIFEIFVNFFSVNFFFSCSILRK